MHVAADQGDSSVAELQEVLRGQPGAAGVVEDGRAPARPTGVDHDERDLVAHDLGELADVDLVAPLDQEAIDAPRFHQQWLPETTTLETFALSPDTRRILEDMGHKFGSQPPANHVTAILVGAPSLGGKPVAANRLYGANDPRGTTGRALGY